MQSSWRLRHRVKRVVVLAHLWLGLTLGFLWALQGFTGAALVFHRDLDRAAFAPTAGASRSLDELLEEAGRAMRAQPESIGLYYPDGSILGVTFPEPRKGKRTVLVDAASGTVLGMRQRTPTSLADGNLWRWVYNLHHALLLGERGEWLLGASGIVLVITAISGVYLAWPRRGQWRAAFAARRWRSRLQKLFGWHRAVGLAAAIAVILLAVSGAIMDFGKPLRAWAEDHAGYHPPYKPKPGSLPGRLVGAERARVLALARFPDAAFTSVTLPSKRNPVYQVRLRRPGEWRKWSGTSLVVLDAGSGRILAAYDAANAPIANQIIDGAFAVHSGEIAALAGRILTAAAGLSLPLLYLTGFWAWLRKRRVRLARTAIPASVDHEFDRDQLRVCRNSGSCLCESSISKGAL